MMSTQPPITLNTGGLSGSGIVEQLVSLQRQPIDTLQSRVSRIQSNKNVVTQIQNRFSSLQTTLKRLTSTSVLDTDLFQTKKATSADADSLTVTATDKAAVQGMDIKINRLATSTIARSGNPIGQAAGGNTLLSAIKNVSFQGGNLSVLVNGQLNTITIDTATDTMSSVLGKISSVSGISSASIDANGLLNIQSSTGNTVQLGSSGDTSNLFRLTRLNTATPTEAPAGTNTFSSSFRLTTLDTTKPVEDASAGLVNTVAAGSSFTIGGATFNTTGKSLAQLVEDINNSQSSGASAVVNHSTGRLELTARGQGNVPLTLKDNSGNFLTAMGLINAGNSVSNQTLGQNAEIEINGTRILSNSNTVDATASGLTGVTLTLKKPTTTTSGVRVTVDRDTDEISSRINTFITQLNDALGSIATHTNLKTGALSGNSTLSGLRANIRSLMVSAFDANPAFQSMGSIGISTGKAGTFTSGGTVSTTYSLDTDTLKTALSTNAGAVKSLLTDSSNGLLTRIKTLVEQSLKTGSSTEANGMGAFQNITTSMDSQITRLNRSIESSNRRLQKYEENLRRQYTATDRQNSQYQSQLSSLSSLNNNG
jgi:flagellar hook-associated protein 2